MIVFDLRCSRGDVFEAWFGSSDDYASQQERGLVSCPLCGDSVVEKAVMAPRIGQAASSSNDIKEALAALVTAQQAALQNSTYVGERFANEALAMHLGETEPRPIHGVATPVEAATLREEGVPIARLPLPVVAPGQEN